MKYICAYLLGIWVLFSPVLAQTSDLSILQMPRDGFWKVSVMNSSPKGFPAVLAFQFKQGNQMIQAFSTQSMLLKPGANIIDLQALDGAAVLTQGLGTIGSPNNPQPVEVCIEIFVEGTRALVQCEIFQQASVMPPHLVYPFDGDELESDLPMFTWTPPAPISGLSNVQYKIRLVEITGFHSPQSAMVNMPAVVERNDISQHIMPYSPAYRKLVPGQEYAWQIEAFSGTKFMGRSELWTFKVKSDKKEKAIKNDPYVMLRKQIDSGYYPALGKVRFRFDCRYGETNLDFKVFDPQGNVLTIYDKQLTQTGKNLFELYLPAGSGLIENQFYRLSVTNNKGETLYLKFKYLYPKS